MQPRKKVKNYIIEMEQVLGRGAFSTVYMSYSTANP